MRNYFFSMLSLFIISSMVLPGCKKSTFDKLSELKVDETGNYENAKSINKAAFELYKIKDYLNAEKKWIEAAKASPSWWKPFYNIACIKALKGNAKAAVKILRLALQRAERGKEGGDPSFFLFFQSLNADSDLDQIRNSEQFKEFHSREFRNSPFAQLFTERLSGSYEEPNHEWSESWDITLKPSSKISGLINYSEGMIGKESTYGEWYLLDGKLYLLLKWKVSAPHAIRISGTSWEIEKFTDIASVKKRFSSKRDDKTAEETDEKSADDTIMTISKYDIEQNENAITKSLKELLGSYKGEKELAIVIIPLADNERTSKNTRQVYSLIVKAIMKDGRFRLIERESIKNILKEYSLKQAGIVESSDSAKMGKITGAKLLLNTKYTDGVIEFKIIKTLTAEVLSFSSVVLKE